MESKVLGGIAPEEERVTNEWERRGDGEERRGEERRGDGDGDGDGEGEGEGEGME